MTRNGLKSCKTEKYIYVVVLKSFHIFFILFWKKLPYNNIGELLSEILLAILKYEMPLDVYCLVILCL